MPLTSLDLWGRVVTEIESVRSAPAFAAACASGRLARAGRRREDQHQAAPPEAVRARLARRRRRVAAKSRRRFERLRRRLVPCIRSFSPIKPAPNRDPNAAESSRLARIGARNCSVSAFCSLPLTLGKFESHLAIAFGIVGPVFAHLDEEEKMHGLPGRLNMSFRAAMPIALMVRPPSPMTIFLWPSRMT